jgi:hypothetical protein
MYFFVVQRLKVSTTRKILIFQHPKFIFLPPEFRDSVIWLVTDVQVEMVVRKREEKEGLTQTIKENTSVTGKNKYLQVRHVKKT